MRRVRRRMPGRYRAGYMPVGWQEATVDDDRGLWVYSLHACSAKRLAEVGMRLALNEVETPEIAAEPALVAKPKRARKAAPKTTRQEGTADE